MTDVTLHKGWFTSTYICIWLESDWHPIIKLMVWVESCSAVQCNPTDILLFWNKLDEIDSYVKLVWIDLKCDVASTSAM